MASNKSEPPRRRRGRKSGEHVKGSIKDKTTGGPRPILVQLTEDAPTWYACGKQTPGRDATIFTHPPPSSDRKNKALAQSYRDQADEIIRAEVQNVNHRDSAGSSDVDERWLENTMRRGTLKDRIAAMSVVVSTDPVHKLHALDGLLQMIGSTETGGQTNARMAQLAAEALEDLFVNTLLPRHRKLVPLEQRPFYLYESNGGKGSSIRKTLSPRVLLLWRYEEILKEKYQLFLRDYLTQTLRDGMEIAKLQALRSAGVLLRSAPEAENQLLSLMVNKLGDPAKKTAAAAGHELRRVLEKHSNMHIVIAREVQQLAHRPHLSARALYNCIIFLNQLKLDHEVEEPPNGSARHVSLPASLVHTYFRLFEVAVNKSRPEKSTTNPAMKGRLLSALLTGVNRAHPYLPDSDKALDTHIDSLYRVVHTAPPAASTQALMLLLLVTAAPNEEESVPKKESKSNKTKQDRFYRALYATLSQHSTLSSGKHLTMYFNLLYKAMKRDADETRVQAFAKRLLCSTMHCAASVTAASLFLLNEVMKFHPQLQSSFVEVIEGDEALATLDPTKREPTSALVSGLDSGSSATARFAPLWEASLTSYHSHPSVSKFALTLNEISYAGDPLRDFALAPFLDKFAYRNPKTSNRSKGKESVAARRRGIYQHELPVNDPSFLKKEEIDEKDEFFRSFFVERARRDEIKGADQEQETDLNSHVEVDALEISEKIEIDQNFEDGWDTDPEEEEFVDALAAKLMDDAEGEQAELDEEDPDMDGWDLSDEEKEQFGDESDGENENVIEDLDIQNNLDQGNSGSTEILRGQSRDIDVFMENDETDSSGDNEMGNDLDSVGDEEGEDDLAFIVKLGEEAPFDEQEKGSSASMDIPTDTFADASEYEELITRAWNERKRRVSGPTLLDEPLDGNSSPSDVVRKRRKRHKEKRSALPSSNAP